MRKMKLTQRQETFCLKYFELGNASEAATIAGYSQRTIRSIASINLTKVNIIARIQELRQRAEDATVAAVLERKQVLTEIVRGRFVNLMKATSEERLNSAALQEIRVTQTTGSGEKTTTFKLHSPIQAIDLLNKMDKLYTDGATINIDNRELTINVKSAKDKRETMRLINGERTG